MITAERLREVLDYEPGTGLFRWKVRTSNRISVGDVAGSLHKPTGYVFLFVDGGLIKAHRAAWLYLHGELPLEIDHINGRRADNRIANLRDVSRSVNQQNLRAARGDTSSGLLGVSWHEGKKKWRAQIKTAGRIRFLGYRHSPDEAHALYVEAKRRLHAGCTI